jgi:hypothetical protein
MKFNTVCFVLAFVLCNSSAFSQFGVKAGVNFANVSGASSINKSNTSGYHVGVLLAPQTKSVIGSRTELIFSKQGYDYASGATTGEVDLNYLQFGQMLSINITKYFSLLAGAQTAYLLNAKVDSTGSSSGPSGVSRLMDLYNRFDYGFAVGAEAHPFKGILIGARFNKSLNKLYKSIAAAQAPSFTAEDAKNNVVQIYLGYRFGDDR